MGNYEKLKETPEYTTWPARELVKAWLFDKLTLVVDSYAEIIIDNRIDLTKAASFRSKAFTFFRALKPMAQRQKKFLSAENKETMEKLQQIVDGKLKAQALDLDFWTRVMDLEIVILDSVGITHIDFKNEAPDVGAMLEIAKPYGEVSNF